MTDVFYVKEGSTSPSISTVLLDSNNDPADVSDAVSIVFQMSGPDDVSGAASFVTDGTNGQVAYDWAPDDLALWGGYAAEWSVTGPDPENTVDVYPGAGYNWVEVMPLVTTPIAGVCSMVDVRRATGRALTDEESVRAAALIQSLSAILERYLHRVFGPREIVETHLIRYPGYLEPYKGPVIEVTGITVDTIAWTSSLTDWEQIMWPVGAQVQVTYTAGSEIDAGVKDAVASVIARTLQVAPVVASGAVESYSVEGTSITYAGLSSATPGQVWRYTVGDLTAFAGLKRPVWRQ